MPQDDMFVALEEVGGYLFWCTNQGYYGFIPLATAARNLRDGSSLTTVQYLLEDVEDLVNSLCPLLMV